MCLEWNGNLNYTCNGIDQAVSQIIGSFNCAGQIVEGLIVAVVGGRIGGRVRGRVTMRNWRA